MTDTSLLPVLAALGGVALAQGVSMLQARLDRKNKREILLRTKYEELGAHFLDSMKLPHTLMKAESTKDIIALTHQASGNHAHLLAMVYFPKLRDSTGQYIDSYSKLCLVAASLYNPNDNRPLGMQIPNKPEYIKARNKHLADRDRLQEQIETHAPTYAKS